MYMYIYIYIYIYISSYFSECAKKIISCGSDVADKFRMGMSAAPDMYMLMGTGSMQDICR